MNNRRILNAGLWAAVLASVLALWWASPRASTSWGQIAARPAGAAQPAVDSKTDEMVASGAIVNSESEINGYIQRAKEYVKEQNYRGAILVLQGIIDKHSDVLTSSDDRTYVPVTAEIEKIYASLPPEGLRVYRVMVDGDAQALMNKAVGPNEMSALTELVRRYFVSTIGDEAALRLASLYMDRFEYAAAAVVLLKIIDVHPDPSVSLAEVRARLTVCFARQQDAKAARAQFELLRTMRGGPAAAVVEFVQAEVDGIGKNTPVLASSGSEWNSRHGTPDNKGIATNLPKEILGRNVVLTRVWSHSAVSFELSGKGQGQGRGAPFGQPAQNPRSTVVNRWETNGWQPTAQMVIGPTYVYYRAQNELISLDPDTGLIKWRSNLVTASNPQNAQGFFGGQDKPTTPEEIMYFGDQIGKEVSYWNGLVYHVGGNENVVTPQQMNPNGGQPAATNGNWIEALQAKSGLLAWQMYANQVMEAAVATTPAGGAAAPATTVTSARFLSAPVPMGNLLIVPVEDNDAVYLVALNPPPPGNKPGQRNTPTVAWRTYLCAGPATGYARWSPTSVAVSGTDVYVLPGRGLVFAVNGMDGAIRWASRYPRQKGQMGQMMRGGPFGGMGMGTTSNPYATGFEQDYITCIGNKVVAAPSDSKHVNFFDRTTGVRDELTAPLPDMQGNSPAEFDYVLGVIDKAIFLVGPNKISKYMAPPDGRLKWSHDLQAKPTGRGLLTADAIYIPIKDKIMALNPDTGKQIAEIGTNTKISDPLGNLFTDGVRIYVIGLEHVYALMDTNQRMAMYTARINKGDVFALIDRARLYRETGQVESAVADLRKAMGSIKDNADRQEEVRRGLLDGLLELSKLKLDSAEPLLAEAGQYAKSPDEQVKVSLARGQVIAAQGKHAEAMEMFLSVSASPTDSMVQLGGVDEGVQVLASRLAAVELSKLSAAAPAVVQPALEAKAREALKAASTGDNRVARLMAVARAYPSTTAAVDAALAAGKTCRESGDVEIGEQVLRELTRSSHAPTAASGWIALGYYYKAMGWNRQAGWCLARVRSDYAKEKITWAGTLSEAGSIAERALAELPADALSIEANDMRFPDSGWKPLVKVAGNGIGIIGTDAGDRSQFLEDHVLVYMRDQELLSMRHLGESPSTTWERSLPRWSKQPVQNAAAFPPKNTRILKSYSGVPFPDGNILRDGHVAVVCTEDTVHGYGLVTGRSVWRTPASDDATFESPFSNTQAGQPAYGGRVLPTADEYRLDKVVIGAGILVQNLVDTRRPNNFLRAIDLATGATVWTRSFEKQRVDGISLTGDYICVVLAGGAEIQVCDRITGRRVQKFALEDRQVTNPLLLWTSKGVVYATAGGLKMKLLETGQDAWPKAITSNSRAVVVDDNTIAAIGSNNNTLRLIDARNGNTVDAPIGQGDEVYRDLAVGPEASEVAVTGTSRSGEYLVAYFDAATGKRKSLVNFATVVNRSGSNWFLAARDLADCSDVIPMVALETRKAGRAMSGDAWTVNFVRRSPDSDAKPVDDKLPSARGEGRFLYVMMPPAIQNGVIYITSNQDGLAGFGRPRPAYTPPKNSDKPN